MRQLMNHGEAVIVETEKDRWVGTAELRADHVVIRTGRAGRPKLVDADAIIRIVPLGEEIA